MSAQANKLQTMEMRVSQLAPIHGFLQRPPVHANGGACDCGGPTYVWKRGRRFDRQCGQSAGDARSPHRLYSTSIGCHKA